jgi:tRNA threonylcarbamoyladenosine biosynthesis protein TsaB
MSKSEAPLILAIETATRAGSVALARGEQVLASLVGNASASRSIDLIDMVNEALKLANARLADVDVFAAASGPGSFTGLRIGLATIKSFSVCEEKQCVGVSTLAAIAHASGPGKNIVAALPAGRGEVFAQLFSHVDGVVHNLDQSDHLTPPVLLEKYGALLQLIWAGEGAHLYLESLREWAASRQIDFPAIGNHAATWTLAPRVDCLAASVAVLAFHEFRRGGAVEPNDLHAVYVRASDAEIKERWQHEKALP